MKTCCRIMHALFLMGLLSLMRALFLIRTWAVFGMGLGLITALSSAAATEKLQAVTLSFVFSYNGIKAAEVRDVFMPTADGGYQIDSYAKAIGLAKILYGDIVRKSEGQLVDGSLQMRRYWQQRGNKAARQADYDAAPRQLHLQKGDEKRAENVDDDLPLLDYLTALYRPYAAGQVTAGKFAITDGWRLREYEYVVGALETITTPAGEFEAVSLRRDSPRGARIFWVAPQLHYLPVKIYIDDKGHVFETVLSAVVVGDDKPVAE